SGSVARSGRCSSVRAGYAAIARGDCDRRRRNHGCSDVKQRACRAGAGVPRPLGWAAVLPLRARGRVDVAKRRGKPWRTTISDPAAEKRPDLVKRDFTATAPRLLWVGDFTYLRTWEGRV